MSIEALAGKPGSKTSEAKGFMAVGLMTLVALLTGLMENGLLQEGTAVYTIATLLISVLGAGGYGLLRLLRKNFKTGAIVEAMKNAGASPDPT